jgi:hypothetical protein
MTEGKKPIFFNLVLLLAALCLAVLLGEGISRIFFSSIDEKNWVGAEKKYYEYDSLFGWKKIPGLRSQRVTAGKPPVSYNINSRSIRGPEYPYAKEDGEYRILVLGDSFAEGFMVEFSELFSEVMKKTLNDKQRSVHIDVINTGTSGWSTDQELIMFQTEGKKYSPDLVILLFYENDITYNNRPKDWGMYYKPLFQIVDGKLELTNVPVPRPDIFIMYDQLEAENKSAFKRLRSWLNVNSYLYKLVKDRVMSSYKLRTLISGETGKEDQENEKLFFPIEYRVWEKKPNGAVRKSWEITEAMLTQLHQETALINSRLLVFYVPFEGSIYLEEWEKLKKQYNLTEENWNVNKPGIMLEDICRRNGIEFINPTALFRKRALNLKKEGIRLYDRLDHHWSVEGNALAGKVLAEYIDSRYLKDK